MRTDRWTDGRTDKTKLTVDCHNIANTPKKYKVGHLCMKMLKTNLILKGMGFAFVRKEPHLIAYNFDQYQTEWTFFR